MSKPYVALLTRAEWEKNRGIFDLGIDDETEMEDMSATKAVVNYDSLIGSFCVPSRSNICGEQMQFAFALDEKGVVFIDDSGTAGNIIRAVSQSKKWRDPSLERFIYDFIEEIILKDAQLLEKYDARLNSLEDDILSGNMEDPAAEINGIKSELRDLKTHYDQLIDMCQELEENENGFFADENIRYFHLLKERLERFRDRLNSLREYSTQVRDLYQSRIDIRQNNIMTHLTIITSIFMPLSLIAGWYGMNFVNMPELYTSWGYAGVILMSVLIVVLSVWYIRRKKWM